MAAYSKWYVALNGPDAWHSDLRAAATGIHKNNFLHSSFDAVTCSATTAIQPERRVHATFLNLSESKQVVEKRFGLSLSTLIVFIGVYQQP
jgi:hypothetical protein